MNYFFTRFWKRWTMADSPRVLSVGQCGYDHGSISRALQQACGVNVDGADTHAQALSTLKAEPGRYSLVLINRVGDRDGAPGLILVRTLKADPALAELPVMLVSNYADAQAEATTAGALPGFGKSDIGSPKFQEILQPILKPAGDTT